MKDAVATFCHECDKVVILSGLEDHIESEHQRSISEYCKFYRKPDTQLIRITYIQITLLNQVDFNFRLVSVSSKKLLDEN